MTQININAYNSVDRFQLIFGSRAGVYVGDGGGTKYTYPLATWAPGGWVSSCAGQFGDGHGIMSSVGCMFNNFALTGLQGNRAGWSGPKFNTTVGTNWALVGLKQRGGVGPSGTYGTTVISFMWRHASMLSVLGGVQTHQCAVDYGDVCNVTNTIPCCGVNQQCKRHASNCSSAQYRCVSAPVVFLRK